MKRRIIQIADSTQLVSLPRAWTKHYGTKKGDEVEVIEMGNKVIVSTEKSMGGEKVELDAEKIGRFLNRAVAALYKSGYDEVHLRFRHSQAIAGLASFLDRMLLGFEIMDQGETYCTIRSISHGMDSEFEPILRKVFLVNLAISKTAVEMLADYKDRSYDILTLEQTSNKFSNLSERLMNRRGYNNYRKTNFIYCIIWEMEKIADEYKYLALHLSKNPPKSSLKDTAVHKLIESVAELLKNFYTLFYKFEETLVAQIAQERERIIKEANELLYNPEQAKIAHHLITVTQHIHNCLGCYIAIAVEKEGVDNA